MRLIDENLATDIIEAMNITETIDTGGSIFHQGHHPELGGIVMTNEAASGTYILIKN